MISFDEMLEESNDEFSIFADNIDIFRRFDCDSLVLITTFIESYSDLSINIVTNCHLTLAAVTITTTFTGDELIHG